MQGCSNCGKTLCKYGIAVSYKINVNAFNSAGSYQIQEDILLCLDDYNDTIKKKFKAINPNGQFELIEWIDQYERKGWYPIANQLNTEDIDSIIKHTVKINNKSNHLKCSVCNQIVKNQIWVCMEESCIHDLFTGDISTLLENPGFKPFNTVVVCNEHIGDSKQLAFATTPKDNHRVMCFIYEKSRKGWIPKNIYRQFPHVLEKKIITRRELIAQFNNDQLNHEALNDMREKPVRQDSYQNDTQELFRRVRFCRI